MEKDNFSKGLPADDYLSKIVLISLSELNCLPTLGPLGTKNLFMTKITSFRTGRVDVRVYLQSGFQPWNWSLFWFHLLLPQSQPIVVLHCSISSLTVSIPAVQERHLSYVCCLPVWMPINSQVERVNENYIGCSILSEEHSIFIWKYII